jgi:non-heme chloroperoxidase
MNTYADDLAALTEKLDLKDAIHVGHSTGGGEVARHIGRHGTKRVVIAVLIRAVPPLMLKTDKNPAGAPISVFDGLRAQLAAAILQGYYAPLLRLQPLGRQDSEGIREHWWLQGGGSAFREDCEERHAEGVSRLSARDAHNSCAPDQCRTCSHFQAKQAAA